MVRTLMRGNWERSALRRLAAPRFLPCLLRFFLLVAMGLPGTGFSDVSQPDEPPSQFRFRWSEAGRGLSEAGMTAVALDRDHGWLASGDGNGVRIVRIPAPGLPTASVAGAPAGMRWDRKLRVSGVTDLGFDRAGRLLVGTSQGFHRAGSTGQLVDHSPGVGRAARRIVRIAQRDRWVLVATLDGAFLADADDLAWRKLDAGFPSGPVTAVALTTALPGRTRLALALVAGTLWSLPVETGDDNRPLLGAPRQIPLPRVRGKGLPFDLQTHATGQGGDDVIVVYGDRLLVSENISSQDPDWRVVRPVLPPESIVRRVRFIAGHWWLATGRGLLTSSRLSGPWRRSSGPAGRADIRALAGDGEALYAAAGRGLLIGMRDDLRAPRAGDERTRVPEASAGPSIRSVQEAALEYLGLEMSELRVARRGLVRRGWLPALGLRFAADRDHSTSKFRDQTFTSGAVRHLRDDDDDRSLDLGASLTLQWDLGDTAFDDRWIDLSREGRLLAALRDDVLDEINQLFFERRSLLERQRGSLELASSPSADDGVLQIENRIGELTAGLDAWTGGWFSEQIVPDIGDPFVARSRSITPTF